jgi:ketosteroid isomerase-like protein
MAGTEAEIEAFDLRFMRAWVAGDVKELKKLVARDFVLMVGTTPPQLLDRPSFLAAAARGFACTRFSYREVLVRRHGKAAWLVAGAELDLGVGSRGWAGSFLVTALWRKGAVGGWKLAERSLARLEPGDALASSVSKLQLWKQA